MGHQAELEDRITEILLVLSEISSSTFWSRLPELPDDSPFCVLYQGINEMADSLATANANAAQYQQELAKKLATIEHQRTAIRELSTPVIEVWEGVLCLPVVGVMDTARSAEITETLLRAVVDKRARCTIIDVTGIEVMDTATADHFLRMAKAVRLLGADCVVTGVSPAIAQTIVHMDVDLLDVKIHANLRDALAQFLRRTDARDPARRNGRRTSIPNDDPRQPGG
jgi:rsbT co-antagonist protein RsbR